MTVGDVFASISETLKPLSTAFQAILRGLLTSLWEQDVAGSNPVIPMGFKVSDLGQPQTSPESPITEYAETPLEIGCFYSASTAFKWVKIPL